MKQKPVGDIIQIKPISIDDRFVKCFAAKIVIIRHTKKPHAFCSSIAMTSCIYLLNVTFRSSTSCTNGWGADFCKQKLYH